MPALRERIVQGRFGFFELNPGQVNLFFQTPLGGKRRVDFFVEPATIYTPE